MDEQVTISIKLFEEEMAENARLRQELAEARAENERLREEITSARIALSGLDASLDVLEELMHGEEDETP